MKKNIPESIYLSIAGFILKVQFQHSELEYIKNRLIDEILNVYKGFRTQKKANVDFKICIGDKASLNIIQRVNSGEGFISFYEKIDSKTIRTYYQISLTQFNVVIRDILCQLLSDHDGFFLHSSCSSVFGYAYIFTGISGAGKSTIMKSLHPTFPALADDTTIIKKEGNVYCCYQTPFIEKEFWINKTSSKRKFRGLYILKKSTKYAIRKITKKEYVISEIMEQVVTKESYVTKQIRSVFTFVNSMESVFELSFGKDRNKIKQLIYRCVSQFDLSKF